MVVACQDTFAVAGVAVGVAVEVAVGVAVGFAGLAVAVAEGLVPADH